MVCRQYNNGNVLKKGVMLFMFKVFKLKREKSIPMKVMAMMVYV